MVTIVRNVGEYTHYYCQPDGGQWNVPVYCETGYLPVEAGDNVVIHGEGLTAWATDTEGHGIAVVPANTVFTKPQPIR